MPYIPVPITISVPILLAYLFYSSYVGVKIANHFPWSKLNNASFLPLPIAVGFGIAPFILGLLTVFSLYFFAGHSAYFHLFFILLSMIILHGITALFPTKPIHWWRKHSLTIEECYFGVFLILWTFFLFFNSFYYALYQNDALEYMTVARQLFITNSLHSYPMVNQEVTASGFYGPWTHPPLYVCLLYFTEAVQGHANVPGLARLITPWMAFLSVLIVYSLGGLHSRLTAVLSAFIFMSTPLFFLGATTSLIDSLPTLGFTLLLALLVGLNSKYNFKWIIVGIITGFSLWTHSQAILLFPILTAIIFCLFGLQNWKKYFAAIGMVLSTTLLLSMWPYIKNWMIFGYPISDNPAVFSLPSLRWNEYFSYARGLDNTFAIIQYGIFKGWFALEAFGIAFWTMTIGAYLFSKRIYFSKNLKSSINYGINTWSKSDLLLGLCFLFLIIYLLGTIASVCIGLNLMVKNERYLLVILPFVAILGGYGGNVVIKKMQRYIANHNDVKKYLYYLSTVVVLGGLGVTFYVINVSYPAHYLTAPQVIINPVDYSISYVREPVHLRLLRNLPSTGMILKAKAVLPKDALILSLRPADMYYLSRKMVAYLDPVLIPLYEETSPLAAVALLKALGINYIHATDYSLPVQYNSVINKILEDPNLSKIIVSNLANEIYQLTPTHHQFKLIKDFTPGKHMWSYYKNWNLMGRKNLFNLMPKTNRMSFMRENKLLDFQTSWALNHRHYSHIIFSGVVGSIYETFVKEDIALKPGKEYRVDFNLEGEGFIRFYIIELSSDNHPIQYFANITTSLRIGEVVLSKTQNSIHYSKRFIAQGAKIIFIVETIGSSKLFIKNAKLYELSA